MQSDSSAPTPATPPFAEPTPLGLLGLAVGCAALIPIAFGWSLTPAAFRTAAFYCLYFGAGCQFIAGIMALANKNLLGGTLFTTFAFNWLMNYQTLAGLSEGRVPDPNIILSVDVIFLVIFVVLTYAFGFFSKLLFAFLLDIVHALRLPHPQGAHPRAGLRAAHRPRHRRLAGIALYLAFAILVNNAAGRTVLVIPGPLFKPGPVASA
jgi:succinate-acetate transporter protein